MRQTAQPHVPVGNKPQNLWLQKPVGVVAGGDTPSLTGEIIGETHRVLEPTYPRISARRAQFACR